MYTLLQPLFLFSQTYFSFLLTLIPFSFRRSLFSESSIQIFPQFLNNNFPSYATIISKSTISIFFLKIYFNHSYCKFKKGDHQKINGVKINSRIGESKYHIQTNQLKVLSRNWLLKKQCGNGEKLSLNTLDMRIQLQLQTMDFRKLKEGEEVLKSVTPELNQRVEQAKSNMWKIQNMFLDEDQGKNFIFHILNDQGKKFSAKILVPEKRKNGEPIILFVVENFIQTPKNQQVLKVEDQSNGTNYMKVKPQQLDKELLKENLQSINEELYTKDFGWKIDFLWRLDDEEYNLIVYQISSTTTKTRPATVVFRERYEYPQQFVRRLVYCSFGVFDPQNAPWEMSSQNLQISRRSKYVKIPVDRKIKKLWKMVESEFNNVSGEDPDTDWDVDDAWEMNDGFDSEIFYTLSNKGNQHRNVVIYTWRFLHPKQRVGYFDDKKNVDPNFGLKGGKYLCEEKTVIPVTLSEKMEKPEVVLQLECPEFLMESKKIEIRISLKDFIQPRNVGYELQESETEYSSKA